MKTASCYTVRYCDILGVLCEHNQTPSLLYIGTHTHTHTYTHTQSITVKLR